MDEQNRRALLGVMLLASRADGTRDEREREAIRGALGRFRGDGLDPEALWQEVESGRRDLAHSARELTSPGARELAYELATCVCDSDGATSERERAFLVELARELGLSGETTERFRREADALAGAARGGGAPREIEAIDELVLHRAILCAGLELLPQRLATLAILPLQMQLVYRIGKTHGYELDQGHLKEFLGV